MLKNGYTISVKKIIPIFLGFILLAPITGELWRFPVMGVNLLPSDILIPIFLLLWGIDKIRNDRKIRLGKIGKALLVFFFVVVIGYFLSALRFPLHEMIKAGAYMGRFFMYLLLIPITFDLIKRDAKILRTILGSMIISFLFISILGFLQLKFFPSFLALGMDLKGWDPHIGRLLSTWFDPNFVGGYLAFILAIIAGMGLYFRQKGNKRFYLLMVAVGLVGLIALYLTYSRSGYLALIGALGILALLKSKRLLIAVVLIGVLGFSLSPRIQERTLNAVDSGKALIGMDSQKPLDPTAKLRVQSWKHAWEIIQDYPIIGAGYNRYGFEVNQRGYSMLSDHDSGGSDSSLLTIWATTGLLGLLAYLFIGFKAIVITLKRIWDKKDFQSYLHAGIIGGFGGMMVHSIFVKFPPISFDDGVFVCGVGDFG